VDFNRNGKTSPLNEIQR